MLSSFRKHTKGWIAWVFVILISVPFALWGIGQYRSVFTTDYIAKVNGEKIMPATFQRSWQQFYQQQENTLGDKFNPSDKEQTALKQQVLNQLIDQTLMRQQAAKNRFVASEADLQAQIEQIPAFQTGGHFDFAQYQTVLAANGYTTKQFESSMRTDLASQELQNGLAQSAFAVPKESNALLDLLQQQRRIAWFTLPLDQFRKDQKAPDDKDIQAYYDAHREQFVVPTTLTIAYVRLGPKQLEARVKPTPEELKAYYASHQNQYGIPPARKAAEIVIAPTPAGTKGWAAAKTQATKLLGQIRAAKDGQKEFAALAAKYSDDATSKRNGGSLGWIGSGQMPTVFDQALFGLKTTGDVAGPIRTAKGWSLIQLLGTRGGSVKPYDEVSAKVEK
ncbi:MAG TPA: SurA N-terminal domain-containing protein, partial [Gammaproteobacteria bacterium]|nr:SurA N-terminal domain-containing protein [Gammaproteobacteria bacterium]